MPFAFLLPPSCPRPLSGSSGLLTAWASLKATQAFSSSTSSGGLASLSSFSLCFCDDDGDRKDGASGNGDKRSTSPCTHGGQIESEPGEPSCPFAFERATQAETGGGKGMIASSACYAASELNRTAAGLRSMIGGQASVWTSLGALNASLIDNGCSSLIGKVRGASVNWK